MPPLSRSLDWVDRLARLYTGVVADILDQLGYRNQCLDPGIRPLYATAKVAGYALTALAVPARDVKPARPYHGELLAVDALQPGDVLVISHSPWSFWGELLSTAAKYRQCRGVILDGPTRDSQAIIAMGFPVFHRGFHPADSLGRAEIATHNVTISCGGVMIEPGDMILADHDGIVVIPSAVAENVIHLAEEKVSGENLVRKALAAGMPTQEAFAKYGIL